MLLFLSGCALTEEQRAEIDRVVAMHRDTAVVADTPIRSEFQHLADDAFANSTPDDPQHFLSLLNVGEDALLARIHLIRSARESIDLQTFIWVDDEIGGLIFAELLNAARRGVKVRLLVDHFCKTDDPEVLAFAATAHENLALKFYNPILDRKTNKAVDYLAVATFKFEMLNQRMHNKVFIVDERIGIVGGRNIEDRYFDHDPFFNFKDRDIIVTGPAVTDMRSSFDEYWNHDLCRNAVYLVDVSRIIRNMDQRPPTEDIITKDRSRFHEICSLADSYSLSSQRPRMQVHTTTWVEFVADSPEKTSKGESKGGRVTERINESFSNAQHRITIQTPYMLLSNRTARLFKHLRRDRPEIDLVFSTNSLAATDAFYVYAVSFKQRRLLVKRLNFEVYELKPVPADKALMVPRYDLLQAWSKNMEYDPAQYGGIIPIADSDPRICIHSKSFVVDEHISYVGSHNFEPRSNKLNTESGVLIWDEDIALMIEEDIQRDAAARNSWVLGERKRPPVTSNISNVVGDISRALPFLDVWPFRYTTSYQLKEGMTPMSPFHPDFRQNYEDVGTFPEVNMSGHSLSVRFIAAFGGWSKPLM
jgi:phosphatidylserine/phosphatidylglycerophosphate/cardiolipin synthase-like enzyme